MKFPRGTYIGVARDPLTDAASGGTKPFSGRVEVLTATGAGLFLVREGEVIAACYREKGRELHGKEALAYVMGGRGGDALEARFIQYRYGPEELALALELCSERGLSVGAKGAPAPSPGTRLDEKALQRLAGLRGVRAVIAFFEGFPVQTAGTGDFEKIAALGEDFMRSAAKVAGEIELFGLEQVTVEGPGGVCLFARDGDLSFCVLADRTAHLGMIRLALGTVRKEMFHGVGGDTIT
ncbi:MAG: roadblock/LC7 domain-containing protein [Methanolinea sp.]|nr:roadblock/LC7 domain-containing protein [Methanolinea sp.]